MTTPGGRSGIMNVGCGAHEGDGRAFADAEFLGEGCAGIAGPHAGNRFRVRHVVCGSGLRVEGSPSLRWSQETTRSTFNRTTTRLLSILSTRGFNSSL